MKKLFNKDNFDFATGIVCLTVVSVGAMLILKYFTPEIRSDSLTGDIAIIVVVALLAFMCFIPIFIFLKKH